ncbi:MAG: hypothetical protein J6Y37_06790 [Paludibacteraceae bacterium]|nr:hypothetical protein [Paludibacteraceae bacterium]
MARIIRSQLIFIEKIRIRLTDSDLHKIVIESVNKILEEDEYYFPNGTFDQYAFEYDFAANQAETPEEFDHMMRRRDRLSRIKSDQAQL